MVNSGEERIEALRIADTFRASVLDSTLTSFVFEITGSSTKIHAFVDLMTSLGEVEVSRTGVSAISRGAVADMPIVNAVAKKTATGKTPKEKTPKEKTRG
jgi:acetolactate synthase-1/3 small subunit